MRKLFQILQFDTCRCLSLLIDRVCLRVPFCFQAVNSCSVLNGGCEHRCVEGGKNHYKCECRRNYQLRRDGRHCECKSFFQQMFSMFQMSGVGNSHCTLKSRNPASAFKILKMDLAYIIFSLTCDGEPVFVLFMRKIEEVAHV